MRYGIWCREVIHKTKDPTTRQHRLYKKLSGKDFPPGTSRDNADRFIKEAANQ